MRKKIETWVVAAAAVALLAVFLLAPVPRGVGAQVGAPVIVPSAALGLAGVGLAGDAGSTDFQRYLATNSNQTAFALTQGFKVHSDLSAYTLVSLGSPNADRKRGVRVVFYGGGDDGDTFTYRIWVARGVSSRGPPSQPSAFALRLLGAGGGTLSTMVGQAAAEVLDTERFADTLTYTPASSATSPTGIGDSVETVFGDAVVYSPANNTAAELILADLGNEGYLIIEFNNAADATCRPNALVALEE